MSEISLKEVEIQRLNLQPGEVLVMKFYTDEVESHHLKPLREQLHKLFPNNEVLMLMLPEGRIELEIARGAMISTPAPVVEENSCALPTSYCSDCSCGKKEMIESINKGE